MDNASGDPVLVERRERVTWLTLNRPDRLNAVSQALYERLTAEVRAADRDPEVRVIVLTGAGRAFCAGADLKAHADSDRTRRQRLEYARIAQRANLAIQRCGKPVVAAVNGHAIGAGLELALSCDFLIAATDAKLRFPELALGTFVGGGVTHTLPERIGMARTRELLLLGEYFSGEQAAALGLANRAVNAARVGEVVTVLADRLAAQAPVPMRHAKRLLRRSHRLSRREVMAAEARALAECMATDDWLEGLLAFGEKRPPLFEGR